MNIDPGAYAEAVERLVRLRDLAAGLAQAYLDPVAKQGAEEMQSSLERVLELLGHGNALEADERHIHEGR